MQARLRGRLNGVARGRAAEKRGEQIESLLTSFRVGLFFVSLIALFVGFFLIYNTVSVSVVQRKREIGTLRCIGMRRSELLRLIVAEALILAVFGAAIGCLTRLATGTSGVVGRRRDRAQSCFRSIGLSRQQSFAARAGRRARRARVGVALFAALHPALEAIQISPLENCPTGRLAAGV